MLAEREQGGGKGVALFAPLRLGYTVAIRGGPRRHPTIGIQTSGRKKGVRTVPVQVLHRTVSAGDAVVRATPVQRNDGGSSIVFQGCTESR